MSFQMLRGGGASTPTTLEPEPRPHVCGRCRNPYTTGNPNCPNARKEQPR